MSNPDLPEDHVVEILARSSVESLLRCKSVCKPWRSRISNPNFVKLHMDRTMMNPINNTFIAHTFPHGLQPCKYYGFDCLTDSGSHALSLINFNSLNKAVKLDLPFPTSTNEKGFVVVGSCNGLLCIANRPDELYLWNPATRQLKDIKQYTIKAEYVANRISLGFGFDHASNDYKVVRIVTDDCFFKLRVEVYSLNKNSWKEIEVELEFRFLSRCPVTVNGSVYWIVWLKNSPSHFKYDLLSFNVQSENFSTISLPDGMCYTLKIFEFKESVVIAESRWGRIDIWALDDDGTCLIKKFTINMEPFRSIVGCLKTGEFVGLSLSNELVLYDSVNKVVKPTQHRMNTFETYNFRIHNYSESLVNLT